MSWDLALPRIVFEKHHRRRRMTAEIEWELLLGMALDLRLDTMKKLNRRFNHFKGRIKGRRQSFKVNGQASRVPIMAEEALIMFQIKF